MLFITVGSDQSLAINLLFFLLSDTRTSKISVHGFRPFLRLDGERHGFPRSLGDDVVVEEVTVDGGLHEATAPHDPVTVAGLEEEAVHPVHHVQRAIATQSKDIVGGENLNETAGLLGALVNHNELWDDGHCL